MLGGRPVSAFQKADRTAFNATWKLDAAASVNPNGPPVSTAAPRTGGGAARGGGGGGGVGAGGGGGDAGGGGQSAGGGGGGLTGGGSGGGTLGADERARFYAMLKVLEQAPTTLVIAATDKDVTLTAGAGKPFHHMTDGKTEKLPTGNEKFGNLEIKTRWDGAVLKREIKTIDGLTVAETYTVSADGRQLTVSLELKSQVERLADAQRQPIKRIYDRAQ
jgi:hypothetical protein